MGALGKLCPEEEPQYFSAILPLNSTINFDSLIFVTFAVQKTGAWKTGVNRFPRLACIVSLYSTHVH